MLIILIASLLPVVLLMAYIYSKDKFNKEPLSMILKALLGGVLAALVDGLILSITGLGEIRFSDPLINSAYMAFGLAGFPEELCKFIFLFLFIWRSRYFDEYYDGIEYGAFVGLGFAGLENVGYVAQYGLQVAVSRALFSVPAHCFFGITMGYFFAYAKFKPWHKKRYFFLSIIVPAILHGIYDFLLMYNDALGNVDLAYILYAVWFVFFFFLFRFAKKRLSKMIGK
jgi:RsiW-degrading membrane proteinase PrsW (M82 family)